MNILVADDEDVIRRNFIKRINRLNIRVDCIYEAKHGLEALDMLKKHEIQICLLDINMPLKNGLELLKDMNRLSGQTRFIIISGYDNFSYAKEAIRYGVYRYLLKPINREEFEEAVLSLYEEMAEKEKERTSHSLILRQILDTIDHHYRNADYSLSGLAAEMELSEGYITKLLKKETAMTFSEYLTYRRLEKAKQMMRSEGVHVKLYEVAEAVGYKNQHYFSQVFKKSEGMSPKEWLTVQGAEKDGAAY